MRDDRAERTSGDSAKILIVDDTPANLQLMRAALAPLGYNISAATSGEAALKAARAQPPDLVLLDLLMPGMDGYETCRRFKADAALGEVPVIFITANDAQGAGPQAFRHGGVDYIAKPIDEEELLARIETHLQIDRLKRELAAQNTALREQNAALQQEVARREAAEAARARADERLAIISRQEAEHWGVEGFVGHSAATRKILTEVRQLQAAGVSSVLILGESGTGKELIARAIHAGSPQRGADFIPVNCSAVPLELAESAFFGHAKGAFTGATADRRGYFELADGGTLFLDELGEMPLALQAKLLRVLEDGVVRPVGGGREIAVDVRVLAATNADLAAKIEAGAFRRDLYFRLARFAVEVPPLRARREDIALLAEHFLQRFAEEMGIGRPALSQGALAALMAYDFPGNIRELKNMIEHALIKSGGAPIATEHLHFLAAPVAAAATPPPQPASMDERGRVLAHVARYGRISNRECCQLLTLKNYQAKYLLDRLCREGALRREGRSRSAHYVLAD